MSSSDLLEHLVKSLEALDIPYAIGGSFAAMSYATYRSTIDIDVVAELRPGDVERLQACFPEPDFHFDEVAAHEAVKERQQFNIIHIPTAMKIDVIPPTDPVARSSIQRAARRCVGGIEARISPPEELIVKKLVYYQEGGSDKHINDIAAMIEVSGEAMDFDRIDSWAASLGLESVWDQIRGRMNQSS